MTNQQRSAFDIPKESMAVKMQRNREKARPPKTEQHFNIPKPEHALRNKQIRKASI